MNPAPHYKNISKYLAIEEADHWTLPKASFMITVEALNSPLERIEARLHHTQGQYYMIS